ncbi:unnamed protein product [Tuber aestivum]|uniref:Uncharacterized protein n=1 Tax=Tuber aestivum TaxID=59557 RepID=A0A292PLW6_9PEZI|nr:unnamed protein product [Tuber aestivum]
MGASFPTFLGAAGKSSLALIWSKRRDPMRSPQVLIFPLLSPGFAPD